MEETPGTFTWLALVCALAPAHAEKQVALVIGNAAYHHADKFANPVHDARGVRDALKNLGFDVTYGEDLDQRGLRRAGGQFADRVGDADVAMVYFAGHGATFGDTPYVVPVDAGFSSLGQVAGELVPPPVQPAVPTIDPCGGPVTASFASRCAAPLTVAQERGLKPKDGFKECDNCPEMVVVPAGAFTMGSPESEGGRYSEEGPQHVVTIGRSFAVGKMHVTVDQFATFVRETGYEASSKCGTEQGANRSWRNPGYAQEGSHPAVCLSWNDAKAYVGWVARKTGKPYRMLTEAEWEYAARGRASPGVYPRFWFGDDENELCRYGNGVDQKARDSIEGMKGWPVAPCNDGYAYTSPAGHYPPNAFGLYDMFGNAWQWTADCWHGNYNGAPADGSAWTTGCQESGRVVRGGSWYAIPWYLRAAARSWFTVAGDNFGFRVVRTLPLESLPP